MKNQENNRRTRKTFYLTSDHDRLQIQGVWQSWPKSRKTHEMHFGPRAMIETNVSIYEPRKIFRAACVRWADYATSTERMSQ